MVVFRWLFPCLLELKQHPSWHRAYLLKHKGMFQACILMVIPPSELGHAAYCMLCSIVGMTSS